MSKILADPISGLMITTAIAIAISWLFNRYGALLNRYSGNNYKKSVLKRIVRLTQVVRAARNGTSVWEASECVLRVVFHLLISFAFSVILYLKLESLKADPVNFDWWTLATPLLLMMICIFEVFHYIGVFYWKMAAATDPDGMLKGLRSEVLGRRGDILHPDERQAIAEYLSQFEYTLADHIEMAKMQAGFDLLRVTLSIRR